MAQCLLVNICRSFGVASCLFFHNLKCSRKVISVNTRTYQQACLHPPHSQLWASYVTSRFNILYDLNRHHNHYEQSYCLTSRASSKKENSVRSAWWHLRHANTRTVHPSVVNKTSGGEAETQTKGDLVLTRTLNLFNISLRRNFVPQCTINVRTEILLDPYNTDVEKHTIAQFVEWINP